ncbi:MAG: hypothetical protein RL708_867 [Bacteroidota bacterium]|jgi:cytochrome c2
MKRYFFLLLIFTTSNLLAQNEIENGKTIFKSRCTACHSIQDKLVGPALKDVDKRHSEDWLIKFVHSSQTLIKNGDADAVKLFNENNQTVMPDHADLKDNDIKNIVAYIKDETLKQATEDNSKPFERPIEVVENNQPLSFSDYQTWGEFFLFLIGLVWVLNYYIRTISTLKKYK